jgi:GTPase SAR1 family protein
MFSCPILTNKPIPTHHLTPIHPIPSTQSTYCETIKQHCDAINRPAHVINLDPAAEEFKYPVSIDVRDLITLEDAMEEVGLGPNGGLLYCMEYLEDSLDDWLAESLEPYGDDDYLIIDCPGQIELYSHLTVFRTLADYLKREGWQVCAVYCLDAQFTSEATKFIAGCLTALSAMVQLELPHLNVLTKMDLCRDKEKAEECLFPDGHVLRAAVDASMRPQFRRLNNSVTQLLDDFGMVSFIPLDITDEESIDAVLQQVDMSIQYGEDQESKLAELGDFGDQDGEDDGNGLDF